MEKDTSTFETLRQLKEWLDAGIITPQEFTTLKQKLLSGESAATPPEAPQPSAAPAFEPTTVSPVEDLMLPPITHHTPLEPVAPMPPMPASPAEPLSRPIVAGRPEASPSVPAATQYSVPAPGYEPEQVEDVEDMPYVAPTKSPLSTILIVGGILALLALVAYLMLGNQESERLTSTSRTAADSLAVTPEEGPQAEQIDLPPVAVPETVRVAPALPPAATPANPDTAEEAEEAPAEMPAETTPALSDNAATARAQQVLESYYADMQAAPFSAAQHFAPTVERFYTLSGTTPAAIEAELNRTHFPEFTEAETQIEPGSLQISPAVSDGSRVVTYRERSKAFRQSMQKHQQTAAQVRVRLDKNFKIIYLRQEKLLENTFTD
ncbi:SHOCT domain-containing protein [Hymenobacter sp. APR13]|uniref:SHOCT domain-containing protein n=1 Tax=Hymenobacter sp. APR13 TaxID=1356852 RepID=UPI0004E030D5|nr:SHOCT domain-containing protein [Hymenobacter sp. APR13]AII52654.1 hypothetical protein N008_11800 [Hymenobacter sp. APR13]